MTRRYATGSLHACDLHDELIFAGIRGTIDKTLARSAAAEINELDKLATTAIRILERLVSQHRRGELTGHSFDAACRLLDEIAGIK